MAEPTNTSDDALATEEAAIIAEMKRRGMSVPGEAQGVPPQGAPVGQPAVDPMGVPTGGDAVVSDGTQTSDPIGRAVMDIVRGVAVEGPGALVRGVGNAIKETGDFVTEGHQALQSSGKVGEALLGGLKAAAPGAVEVATAAAPAVSWLGEKVAGLYDKRETVTGNVIESISQFATGLIGGGKFTFLPKAIAKGVGGKIAEGVLKGAVVDMLVFDGNDKRLSNLIEDYPELQNPITDFLAAKDDDPEMLGRLKNALEGAVIGPMADVLILSLKARKLFAHGDVAGGKKAADQVEEMLAGMRDEAAGGKPQDVAIRALDPDNGTFMKADGTIEVRASREGAEVPPKAEGEAPKAPDAEPAPKPVEDPAAPYSTDLPMPKDGRGPIELKADEVIPQVSKADAQRTVDALQSKYTVAGREMVENGADFNFRTIANEDDLKAAINAVSAAQEKLILRTKGGNAEGVLTERMLIKQRDELADMFQADPDHMMLALGNDARTMERMAARFQAYKGMMQKAVNDAANKANAALALPEGSAEAIKANAEALHSAMIASQVQAMVKGVQTNTARTLNAMKMAAPSDVLSKSLGNYEELAQRLQSGTFHTDDKKLLKHLAALKDNPKGFVKFMEASFGKKVGNAYTEWLLNAMLSGPKTHIANMIGNTLMTGYMPLERAMAGMMPGSGRSTVEVLTRLKDEYDGMGMALFDSFRVAGLALKQNRSVLDPHNSSREMVPGVEGGFSARNWGLTKDVYDVNGTLIRTDTTPYLSSVMDSMQTVIGIPSRLLTTQDELFKQINYRSFLYVDAAAKARKAGLKSGTTEFTNYVSQEMNRGFDANGIAAAISPDQTVRGMNGDLSRTGLQQSREATFTQDLEYGISRWLQGMANDSPFVRTIVPFVRTPVNIFRFAVQHGPLAPIEAGWRANILAGGDARRKALAQLSMGTGMWTAAIWLANNGVITGGFSANPEVRQGQELNGAKEYAIKLGDKYVQYNRLEPYGTVFGIAADMAKVIGHVSEADADKLAKAATITLARNLGSKTYVQGLVNMFNAIGDAMQGRSVEGLNSFAYKTAASIAIPSLVNTFRDDEALRQVRNMVDGFKSRLPGYSKDVAPVRNFLGAVVDAPQGWLIGSASPLGYGKLKGDPLYEELADLMGRTQAPLARMMPNLGDTKIDLREVTLPNGQNAYDRMQQLLWNTGVHAKLTELVGSEAYKNATDGSPDYPTADGSKSWLINRYMQQYREVAKGQLLAENPELNAMYMQEMRRSKTEGFLGPQEPAYRKPGFLESLFSKPNDLGK